MPWPGTGISFPRWRKCIPAFARRRWRLWCRRCWRSSCCLLGGSFRQFFSLAIFAEWLFYMIAGTTVFVFRRRDPEAVRPYRVWGYPVVPVLFVLASAVLLYFTFRDNYPNSAFGCLVILAGIPVFYGFARRRRSVPEILPSECRIISKFRVCTILDITRVTEGHPRRARLPFVPFSRSLRSSTRCTPPQARVPNFGVHCMATSDRLSIRDSAGAQDGSARSGGQLRPC